MKLCIDGFSISQLKGTGMCSYTYEILTRLLDIYPQPRYEVIWDETEAIETLKKYKNLSYTSLPLNRAQNDYSPLEDHIIQNRIHIYHSPNNGFSIPIQKVCKYVMTVHDLVPLSLREYADTRYYEKFMNIFPKALERCDKIIAVSHFIEKELISYFHIPQKKVEVIYPGCPKSFHTLDKQRCKIYLKGKYGIQDEFILFAGSIHIRKNLPAILKAFKKISGYMTGLKLIIAGKTDGKRSGHYLELTRLCRDLFIEDKVFFTGTVDYDDMPYFYNSALCAVNLSSYEGFPLSSVEALSCGTPAICSKSPFFFDVLGEGGIYTDADNANELSDTILEAAISKAHRNNIITIGKEQCKKYNSDICTKKLIGLYESIA